MKTCVNHRMDETSYGIKEGRKSVSQYGSNAEAKLLWVIRDNISLRSRVFVFTDYDYAYGDWEKYALIQYQPLPVDSDLCPYAL